MNIYKKTAKRLTTF